jgi:ABC-type siderophore export system fused ATPase/permease subunit
MLTKAQDNIRHQQHLTKERYEKHRKNMSYAIGDLVFLKVRANRTKLDERWIGPCQVIKKTGEQTYLVEDNVTGKTTWAHISQLQPVMERRV